MDSQRFRLKSAYQPTGDQPQAIAQLLNGLHDGQREQTLLGVTGSGKTFTMANIIAQRNVPTLILAHNKTLHPRSKSICTQTGVLLGAYVSRRKGNAGNTGTPERSLYAECHSS